MGIHRSPLLLQVGSICATFCGERKIGLIIHCVHFPSILVVDIYFFEDCVDKKSNKREKGASFPISRGSSPLDLDPLTTLLLISEQVSHFQFSDNFSVDFLDGFQILLTQNDKDKTEFLLEKPKKFVVICLISFFCFPIIFIQIHRRNQKYSPFHFPNFHILSLFFSSNSFAQQKKIGFSRISFFSLSQFIHSHSHRPKPLSFSSLCHRE
jgi:hypothetical protein